ncbi:cyclic AMP-dependent transcription factor ATF-2 [Chelonus insularis]|uniref:cyclic AMP-dependent transcription factor ATF-2 n=1 Tax=Chelonus insularis TaxID=460826 RepID=UPI00158BD187|nr:cyclic AMP-dependent transcription factor ATF-2 [Chelonus insularis]
MSDSEKPFACSSPGCNMSFTNEDHLVVHKKKHDMILNLGSAGKSGAFIADQTPTPTRFIRNCEEVGLFQDLQNVNPFEETFRRAVEGKIGALPESEIGINDDTLHTPHVFPHIEDNSASKIIPHVNADVTSSLITESLSVKKEKEDEITSIDGEKSKNIMLVEKVKKTTETIVIQEADTSIIPQAVSSPSPTSLSINGEDVQLLLKTQDGKLMQLTAIPMPDSSSSITSPQSQQSKSQTIVLNAALPLKTDESSSIKKATSPRLSLAKMKLRQTLVKHELNTELDKNKVQNENSITKKSVELQAKRKNDNYIDLNKKQQILARNRASSMRARAKRKEWINQLQKSVNEANEINTKLHEEVNTLRSEVTRLKTLLLAHKDCPVTKAMEKDNGILFDSKVMPLPSSQFVQTAPLQSDNLTMHGIKRAIITSESPKAVKKQQLISTSKQSILLPKTNEKTLPVVTTIVGNSCGALKILDLGHIVDEKRGGKPILIVHNSPQKKMQVINSRQIVQVDQSLQLINVASKSTGT